MTDAVFFMRGMAFGIALLMLIAILLRYRGLYTGRILAVFLVTVGSYIVRPLLTHHDWTWWVLDVVGSMTPLTFLLFAEAAFLDHRRPSLLSLAAGISYIVIAYSAAFNIIEDGREIWLFSRVIMIAVLLRAIHVVLSSWTEDLMEPRRRLRLGVISTAGAYIMLVIIVESFAGRFPIMLEPIHAALILLTALAFVTTFLLLEEADLARLLGKVADKPKSAKNKDGPTQIDRHELDSIRFAMEGDHLYRDHDMSLSALSAKLDIPEHRLRRLINQLLGYRNFNDFLNHYRLQDVKARLAAPANGRTPVLTLAMDSGYRSMTTFNKAFKASEGVTPTRWRKDKLGIS